MSLEVDHVAVVGAGTMGFGIALEYARAGAAVRLHDADEAALAEAHHRLSRALETLVEHGEVEAGESQAIENRVETVDTLSEAVAGVDLVTEAVVEDLEVKQSVFASLADLAPADAILATNTSGLSVTDIGDPVDDASRVLGTHWFNPPHIVPLVEVVTDEATDPDLADAVYAFFEDIGKAPVLVEKDIPGFVGNRIQTAMAREAFALLEDGVASAADIDRAVAAGFGFRLPVMGVFEKTDQSGLDVHHEVETSLLPELDRSTEPSRVITDLVESGHLGLKTGRGIYDWTDVDEDALLARRDDRLLDLLELYREGGDPGPE